MVENKLRWRFAASGQESVEGDLRVEDELLVVEDLDLESRRSDAHKTRAQTIFELLAQVFDLQVRLSETNETVLVGRAPVGTVVDLFKQTLKPAGTELIAVRVGQEVLSELAYALFGAGQYQVFCGKVLKHNSSSTTVIEIDGWRLVTITLHLM